jgi:hypothetical protein
VHAAAIIIDLLMEVAPTSETSVNLQQTTRRNISEDSHVNGCFLLVILHKPTEIPMPF